MRVFLTLSVAVALAGAAASGQSKPPVPIADFGQWESLLAGRAGGTGPLSPDGRWLAYNIQRANGNHELRVVEIGTGKATVAPFGTQPAFSADSQWLAYGIGVSEAEEEKLQKARKSVRRKAGILELASGQTSTIDDVESFAFSNDGRHLAMKRYAPEAATPARSEGAEATATEERDKPGTTLIVRTLAARSDLTFGNVVEFAWHSKLPLLALAIGVDGRHGNGVHLFNAANGVVRVLDSAEAVYAGLTWRKDADDLAVLRSRSDDGRDGPTHVALAWQGVADGAGTRRVLDPTGDGVLPRDRRIVAWRRPEWSKDGRVVFVGVAAWGEKIDGKREADDAAGVDVWHWRDVDVIPLQKKRISTDRQRNLAAAWHLDKGSLVMLADNLLEDVRPLAGQPVALVVERAPYAMERSIGRPQANLAVVDLATGARRKVKDGLEDQYLRVSPDGRFVLYFLADHYWVYNVASGSHTNLTKAAATSFTNRESDATVKQKPPYGVAGWTTDSASVWLYDRFDVWDVPMDGRPATRLTDGASEQIRHRYASLDPEAEWIDRGKPLFLTLFGEWTKRSGYARLDPSATRAERVLWADARLNTLAKAKDAETFVYMSQAFHDSPDLFVGGPSLTDAKQVTTTNAFQEKYVWGRSELVEYKSAQGKRLQGALFYPAGYEPGKRYPMIVYMYELLSDGLHQYVSPSERAPYNASVFTSQGYFVLQPDIVFRPREPGLSVVECVVPAVKAVLQKGAVDPARVGIIGHSWGGFDTVFLATHTDTFAAAIAGAPITNLVSNYGNHHWSSGIAETDHIETGQQRMEVPLWEDLQAYIRNSAVFGAHAMKTPLLLMFGENDGTVHWHQGVELYNIARRAAKPVVMLAYAGEDHGLRRRPNQIDYQRRILDWFGHYLKGEPAKPWIERGVTALERENELKQPAKPPAKPTTTSSSGPPLL